MDHVLADKGLAFIGKSLAARLVAIEKQFLDGLDWLEPQIRTRRGALDLLENW